MKMARLMLGGVASHAVCAAEAASMAATASLDDARAARDTTAWVPLLMTSKVCPVLDERGAPSIQR